MTAAVEQPAPTVSEGMQQRLEAFARLDDGARAEVENGLIRDLILDVGRRIEQTSAPGLFTSDDLRPVLPPVNMNRIGRTFAQLKTEGKLIELGWRHSTVPSAHGRRISVYRVAECLR